MLVGLFVRVGTALRFPSVSHTDEILELQEPAHRLAYGYGVVAWEWRRGARSWVFPAFLAGVMRSTDWIATGSTGYQAGMAVVLSLISLVTIWFGFAWGKRAAGTEAAIIAAGACAIWYELVYFGPKTLNEVVAAHALLPGLYLGIYGDRFKEKQRMLLAGIFCGLAVALRIQLAPAVAVAVFGFCYSDWRKRILPLAAGLLLPVLCFGMTDALTWGHPFQSYLEYFRVHAHEMAGPKFPRPEPTEHLEKVPSWIGYPRILLAHLGPVALLVILGIRRSPILGWIALAHLVFHSFFHFSLVRYLYPLMPLEITLAALGVVELIPALNSRRKTPLSQRTIMAGALVFIAVCSCLLAWQVDWRRWSGNLRAFDELSHDSTLCGVGVYDLPWFTLGDYAHLHQNVPIVILGDEADLKNQWKSFNSLVIGGTLSDPTHTFNFSGCTNGVCLYRRQGECEAPAADHEINAVLLQHGW
jgi:hypothetical protein